MQVPDCGYTKKTKVYSSIIFIPLSHLVLETSKHETRFRIFEGEEITTLSQAEFHEQILEKTLQQVRQRKVYLFMYIYNPLHMYFNISLAINARVTEIYYDLNSKVYRKKPQVRAVPWIGYARKIHKFIS